MTWVEQKAKYLPGTLYYQRTSRFGMRESSAPTLYLEQPIDKQVIRVDCLEVLKELWGENILMTRNHIYELLAGNVSDKVYRRLWMATYLKFSKFRFYVDEKYLMGGKETPFFAQIFKPAKELVDKKILEVEQRALDYKGKILMETHGYVYLAFPYNVDISSFGGETC